MTPERLQEIENSIGRIECPACGGSGVYLDGTTGNEACEECDGSGMVSQFAPADDLIAEIRRLTAEREEAPVKQIVLPMERDTRVVLDKCHELWGQLKAAEATIATLRAALADAERRITLAGGYHERTPEEVRLAALVASGDGDPVSSAIRYLLDLVDAGRNRVYTAEEKAQSLREQLQAAQQALRAVEWTPIISEGALLWCASCAQLQRDGHHRHCQAATVLAMAAQPPDTLPPLPSGWEQTTPHQWVNRKGWRGCPGITVLEDGDVYVDASYYQPADLITVLRHAAAAQQRLAHSTPAQEGQE